MLMIIQKIVKQTEPSKWIINIFLMNSKEESIINYPKFNHRIHNLRNHHKNYQYFHKNSHHDHLQSKRNNILEDLHDRKSQIPLDFYYFQYGKKSDSDGVKSGKDKNHHELFLKNVLNLALVDD